MSDATCSLRFVADKFVGNTSEKEMAFLARARNAKKKNLTSFGQGVWITKVTGQAAM